jgi:hypothetical protein
LASQDPIPVQLEGRPPVHAWRLQEGERIALRPFCRFIRLEERWFRYEPALTVPKVLAALEHRYGPTGEDRGDKGTFSVVLLLSWKEGEQVHRYVLSIGDRKGAMSVSYWRVEPQRVSDAVGEPSSDFGADAMWACADRLVELWRQQGEVEAAEGRVRPFHRVIWACLLVYGFHAGRFFQREFEEETELRAFLEGLEPVDALLEARRDEVLARFPCQDRSNQSGSR